MNRGGCRTIGKRTFCWNGSYGSRISTVEMVLKEQNNAFYIAAWLAQSVARQSVDRKAPGIDPGSFRSTD